MGNELDLEVLNICGNCKKCKEFPTSYWSEIPDCNCDIAGIIFLKRQEAMQKVRRAKEELLDIKVLKSKTSNIDKINDYNSYEEKLNFIINKYKNYGSIDW